MEAKEGIGNSRRILIWIVSISVTLAVFYLMDQMVMGMQGLPLGWDLSPAQ